MKKLIISLIASFLLCAFAYGQPNRPDPVEEHRKVEKWLEGHKAEAAKLERDLDVKIAEANKMHQDGKMGRREQFVRPRGK